jgi:ATP/maltotriose-dependent transcriptional regulator MalT/predicted ATPase/class 3 adenylate cyclase
MPDVPTGTLTLLFTDLERSTTLLQQLGEQYSGVLADYRHLLRTAFGEWNGHEVDTQGDAFFIAFTRATDAVSAAIAIQRALADHPWPAGVTLRTRIGVHTGEPQRTSEGYVGLEVHQAARIMSAGHGGQILLSQATAALVEPHLPEGASLRDLGTHRLKDLHRTTHLFQLVVAGLPAAFPPLKTLENHPNNLPLQPTAFLGREKEVAELCTLLRREEVRLVTLTGPAGVGKTRLGLQVAAVLADYFADGVYIVPLTPVHDPAQVLPAIMQTLSISEAGNQAPLALLQMHLKDKQLLLLLDNFEQVVKAALPLATLLPACHRLTILVTSREVLRVQAERAFVVSPLSVPSTKRLPDLATLVQYDAVALFVERAQAVTANFQLTVANAPAVAALCARLDGLPLAIELAAARTKYFAPQVLLEQVEHGLSVLSRGARDLPARQQTLRGAMAWSYDLLPLQEQQLFRRLSVFVNGCTVEAADLVCLAAGGLDGDILEGLLSLVDKNLLRPEEQAQGKSRFGMLQVLREYGLECLDRAREREVTWEAHATYYLALAEEANAHRNEIEWPRWLDQLELEHENLRAALTFLLERTHTEAKVGKAHAERALRFCLALYQFWWIRGYFREAQICFERALAERSDVAIRIQAEALYKAATLAHNMENYGHSAEAQVAEALTLYRALGDKTGRAHCLSILGLIAYARSEYAVTRVQLEEAQTLYREVEYSRGQAYCLAITARVCLVQGEYERAHALLEESLELCRAVGDTELTGWVLYLQAQALFVAGADPERAFTLAEQSLALLRGLGEKQNSAYTLSLLGEMRLVRGEQAEARALLEESEATLKEIGDRAGVAEARMGLARAALLQGDTTAAHHLYQESLALLREIGSRQPIPAALEGLGIAVATQGEPLAAARLWGAAEALREAMGTPLPTVDRAEYERAVTRASAQVGKEAFASAWAEGRIQPLEEALVVAAHLSGPGPAATVPPGMRRDLGLATRLHLPRPRTSLVDRPHLIERLQQGMERTLTLVSAPAGFGKTTLLSQWLAERSTPVAWLSLAPEDNDPTHFLSSVMAALQTVDAQLGAPALTLLQTPQPPPPETVLAALTNDLVSRETGELILVLDDYHVITADPVHRALQYLIERLPPRLHLVLSTRADPPLPLARLRARGQLSELRAAELRFMFSEISVFLQTVMGLNLSAGAIAVLERRTEGWIAGLQLAALSLQGRADVDAFLAAFTGSHRFVLDYLSEEVLSHLPEPVQAFLFHTCILDRLSAPLCDAVMGQEGSQTTLELLEQTNLFLVPLDEERRWYRYHHLFAEVLQSRLQQTAPVLVPVLHRRASTWFEEQGLATEAVQHALAASDLERAARLLEQVGRSIILRGKLQTVSAWLGALPETLVRTRPLLSLYRAITLQNSNQLEAAERCLQDAEQHIPADLPTEQARLLLAPVVTIRASNAFYVGDLARGIALAQSILEVLPETERETRPFALMEVAYAFLVSGEVGPAAEHLIAQAQAAAQELGSPFLLLRSLILLARLRVLQGQLHQAAATYQQAAPGVPADEQLRYVAGGPLYSLCLGDLLREWNELEEAARHLSRGLELVQETRVVEADVVTQGYLGLARVQQARSEYSQAVATLDAFTILAHQRAFVPHLIARGAAVRAELELAQGNLARAIRWADEGGLSASDDDPSYPREQEYLALARVRIAQGRTEPAGPFLPETLDVLERLLVDAEAKARRSSVLEILLLQALARDAQGDRKGALQLLEHALQLAEPEGYLRLFLDEGEPMVVLLREAHAHSVVPLYVATLLSAYGEQVPPPLPPPTTLVEPLTEREREVLRLLAEGASNREMARRLVVSVNTVKKHVFNICGKLGVESRGQALAKARSLHLV